MEKLVGVVFIAGAIFVFTPAVAAGISLSTGMTIVGVTLAAIGVLCFA